MISALTRPTFTWNRQVQRNGIVVLALTAVAWSLAVLPLDLLMVCAASFAAVVTVLRWPWLVWPAAAIALPVASGTKLGVISVSELILLAAVCLWLMDGARRSRLETFAVKIFVPIGLYIGVLSISLLHAPALADGIAEVVKWAEFALVLALLPTMVTARNAIWVIAALVLAGALQAGLGIYQFVFQIGPEWFIIGDRFMRASGSFRQPNPFAGYLGVVLPIAFSMTIWSWLCCASSPGARLRALPWAAFFGVAFIATTMGMLASWSRGGWIATVVALLVVVAVWSRRGFMLAVGTAAIIVGAGIAGVVSPAAIPPEIAARLSVVVDSARVETVLRQPVTDENFAVLERLAHWIAGYRMWESSPWLGIGAGNYGAVYGQYRLPLWEEPLGHAHNLYLNTLAETGLAGLAALIILWASLALWSWRRRNAAMGSPCAAVAAGVLGALTYLAVHSMVDVLFVQGIYISLALLVAALAARCAAGNDRFEMQLEARQG